MLVEEGPAEHHHQKSPPWPSNSPRTSSSDARSGGAAACSWRKVPPNIIIKITALAVKLAADIIIRRSLGWCSLSLVEGGPAEDHHQKSPPWPSNSPRTLSSDATTAGYQAPIKRLSSVYVFRSGSPNMCIDYRAIRSWRKVPRTSSSKFTALAVKLAADIIIRRYYGWLSSAYQASIKRLCFSVWFPEHVH